MTVSKLSPSRECREASWSPESMLLISLCCRSLYFGSLARSREWATTTRRFRVVSAPSRFQLGHRQAPSTAASALSSCTTLQGLPCTKLCSFVDSRCIFDCRLLNLDAGPEGATRGISLNIGFWYTKRLCFHAFQVCVAAETLNMR